MIRRIPLLAILLLSLLPRIAVAERDTLAPLPDMPQAPVASVPDDLFMPKQVDAMNGYVIEARQFGIPLTVRAIALPTSPATWHNVLPMRGAFPTSQGMVQQMADDWLAAEPLESSPGAADGILLFVVVSRDDHSKSMAAFATGKNALPVNGLTRQSLDDVLERTILPFFQKGAISDGIRTGVAMLSYDNLFARPARLQRTTQQNTLFEVTNTALLGITLAAALALVGFAWWIRGRHTARNGEGHVESAFEAGAIRRGRVDDAVTAGALVHLVHLGALEPRGDSLRVASEVPVTEPFEQDILGLLSQETTAEGVISAAAFRRIQDVLGPARSRLENRLAGKGLVNPDARVERTWLVLASALVAVVALMALVPSIISMSRLGLFGILVATLAIIGVVSWASKRSWTTPAGDPALSDWLALPRSEDDLRVVDTIANQDALLDTPGGPGVPPLTHLVREFRGLGAG